MSFRLWVTKVRCAGETHLVTSKSGKRMLFLMKMVKLFTSSIGSLERTTEADGWGGQAEASRTCAHTHILHIAIVLLRWTPSGDLTLASGLVDGVFGGEADSRNCTCAICERGGGVTSRAVKRVKPQLTISEDGAEMFVAVFVCAAVKPGRGLKGTNRHMTSLLSEYSHWYILQGVCVCVWGIALNKSNIDESLFTYEWNKMSVIDLIYWWKHRY